MESCLPRKLRPQTWQWQAKNEKKLCAQRRTPPLIYANLFHRLGIKFSAETLHFFLQLVVQVLQTFRHAVCKPQQATIKHQLLKTLRHCPSRFSESLHLYPEVQATSHCLLFAQQTDGVLSETWWSGKMTYLSPWPCLGLRGGSPHIFFWRIFFGGDPPSERSRR